MDQRANPSAIFVYRNERTRFVKQMGAMPIDPSSATTPVIYRLDLHSPNGFFLAQNFAIRNKDIIYYPNAGTVGLMKLPCP